MLTLYHGTRLKPEYGGLTRAHYGQCWTDEYDIAYEYALQGDEAKPDACILTIELDLTQWEIEYTDITWSKMIELRGGVGTDSNGEANFYRELYPDADIVCAHDLYDDTEHDTYRLLSKQIVRVVDDLCWKGGVKVTKTSEITHCPRQLLNWTFSPCGQLCLPGETFCSHHLTEHLVVTGQYTPA